MILLVRTVSHLRGDGDGVDAEEVISTVANMFKDNIVHSVTSDVMSVTKKIIYDANGWLKKRIKANLSIYIYINYAIPSSFFQNTFCVCSSQ